MSTLNSDFKLIVIQFYVDAFFRGKSIHPFCNKVKQDPLQTECTDDRSSVALCNLIEHAAPLPKKYQVIMRPSYSKLETLLFRATAYLPLTTRKCQKIYT